jgi:hypothetical protein
MADANPGLQLPGATSITSSEQAAGLVGSWSATDLQRGTGAE